MRGVGVRHYQLRERRLLKLGAEVQPRRAREVVEPVAALQILKLGLEHELEGRAEHAAKRLDCLGETADPQVDVAETGGRNPIEVLGRVNRAVICPVAGAVQEVEPVRRCTGATKHDIRGRGALFVERGGGGDGRMYA